MEVFGLHELLLEQQKQNRNDEKPVITESEENVTNCVNINVADNNDVETSESDIESETEKKRSPEELLKSSPKYNNWLARLSSKRKN